MNKLSLSKKLLLAGSILSLAVACQSKPIRQPSQSAQPVQSEIQEQCDEEENEESSWDHTESFKVEEKQMKSAAAPAPADEGKKAEEAPKPTVAVPAAQPAAPVVETKASAAPTVEKAAPAAPAVPVVEKTTAAPVAPVAEKAAPEAPAIEAKASEAPVVEAKVSEAATAAVAKEVVAPVSEHSENTTLPEKTSL